MVHPISIDEYFLHKSSIPLLDVRSPGEYNKGHIPGAINIPLFSDNERAEVGTLYVQNSKEEAIELAYRLVNPKLDWFIQESNKYCLEGHAVVHCWRGGMRSKSFAEHLSKNGFREVYVVNLGYKAFRRHVLEFFEQEFCLRVLGGYTGSGKTHILKAMESLGEQVTDLEKTACHKGSAFGSIGEENQPTVEQFENSLFNHMRKLDLSSPIWIEDESHRIGRVEIPIKLYHQMRDQRVFFIDVPKEIRAKHLVGEYSNVDNSEIAYALEGIKKRLGGDRLKLALEYLDQNDYLKVAMLALHYYDKAYGKGLAARNQEKVTKIKIPSMDHEKNARLLIKHVEQNGRN